jgi:hypothetical protein
MGAKISKSNKVYTVKAKGLYVESSIKVDELNAKELLKSV